MALTRAELIAADIVIPGNSSADAFVPVGSDVPTNGLYLPATNSVAISTNGTGRLFVDASGNVGVKTGSPSVPLEIARQGSAWAGASPIAGTALFVNSGSASTTSAARVSILSGNAASAAIYFGDTDNNSEGIIQLDNTSDSLQFSVNGSERLRITSDGKVGLGASNPGSYGANLVVANTSGNSVVTIAASTTGTSGLHFADGTATGPARAAGFIQHDHTTNSLRFGIADSTKATLTSTGLGIGTTAPTSDLSFGASSAVIASDTADGSDNKSVTIAGGGTSGTSRGAYLTLYGNEHTNDGGAVLTTGTAAGGNLTLQARATDANLLLNTAGTEKARITPSGQLLVGTASSSGNSLLQVEGPIEFNSIQLASHSRSYTASTSTVDVFNINFVTGHNFAELTWAFRDTGAPNGVRIGKLYIVTRGSGTNITVVNIASTTELSLTNGSVTTITWSASVLDTSNITLSVTGSTESGGGTLYVYGTSSTFKGLTPISDA